MAPWWTVAGRTPGVVAEPDGSDCRPPVVRPPEELVVTTPERRVLGVVHDDGAAGPRDIWKAASNVCELIFVSIGEPVDALASWPHELAEVVALDTFGDAAADPRLASMDSITTFSEPTISAAAEIGRLLGLRYHRPEVARALTDKDAQRSALVAAGVSWVKHATIRVVTDVDRAGQQVGFPAVIKPSTGSGSRNTYRVDDQDHLHDLVRRLLDPRPGEGVAERSLQLETLLVGDATVAGPGHGDYVSVESVWCNPGWRHVAVLGKHPLAPPFRERGSFFPSSLDADQLLQVQAVVDRALDALGVECGVTHTEVKLTAGGPQVIEVNGRTGGAVHKVLAADSGIDLNRLAVRSALGHRIEEPETVPTPHRISFEYLPEAPLAPGGLDQVTGLADVRARDGISRISGVKPPGYYLDHRDGTESYLCVVDGLADSLDQMQDHLRAIATTIEARMSPLPGKPFVSLPQGRPDRLREDG
jgi:biotin carboxylase